MLLSPKSSYFVAAIFWGTTIQTHYGTSFQPTSIALRTRRPLLRSFPTRKCWNGCTTILRHSSQTRDRLVSRTLMPSHQEHSIPTKRLVQRQLWLSSNLDDSNNKKNTLDTILSNLTSAFPFFVLGAAILGLLRPSTLLWTNRGTLISTLLACVMCGTGLTLTKDDFTKVLKKDWKAVPAGVICQFGIMPLAAWLVGTTMLLTLPDKSIASTLFLGLSLVGCAPGGTASNLVSLIAKADVALSVLLTSTSTILAAVMTPLLVKLLVSSSHVTVSGWTLCEATARVVLFPVLLGMYVNAKAPNLATRVSRWTPFASVLIVSLICGGVVAQNASLLVQSSTRLVPVIVASVLLTLHTLGFLIGYGIPKWGFRFGETISRTISIETGMQNSALAVVLARSMGADPLASLPGALSATVHSCLGSLLAAYWRMQPSSSVEATATTTTATTGPPQEDPDEYPELLI